jgi:hypothetical protein
MELQKSEYSFNRGDGKLNKVSLSCENPIFYELTNLLYKSDNEQAIILNALYNSSMLF